MLEALILFQTIVMLFLGCMFSFLAYKLIRPEAELPIPFKSKEEGDLITKSDRVPLDQFVPRKDTPVKIKYSTKDNITRE